MKIAELREHARLMGFTPSDQVRWLAPVELTRTALKVYLSSTFAGYIDRREVQAALPKPAIAVVTDPLGEELWLDFVADLGDGFDATFTVANLLAADSLQVSAPDGDTVDLPRGRVLVLGGDEVYPTPSAVAYEDRTRGPYRAALPTSVTAELPVQRRPLMLALPGNHDWYDGLTAFLRLFCQRRPIGGWRTAQTRSYFAVELPNHWWLVGVDTQLGTYIDEPQIQYFREHLSSKLQPGDAVILCSPAPTWVHTGEGNPDAFNSLHWFEQHVVGRHESEDGQPRPTHAAVRLWLTGDLHHYARYEEQHTGERQAGAPRQFITCGLGGSFLAGTHDLPAELTVPPSDSRLTVRQPPTRLRLVSRYPDPTTTRKLMARVLSPGRFGLPMRNPGFWRLCGSVQAILLLMLAGLLGQQLGHGPVGALRAAGVPDVVRLAWQSLIVLICVLAFFAAATMVRAQPDERRQRLGVAYEVSVAVALQLVVTFAALLAVTVVDWPADWPSWLILALLGLVTVAVVGLLSAYAFAVYMLLSRSALVRSWRMSAQAIEDGKGFLRLRFAADGSSVQVHPVVVDTVHHDWLLDGSRPVPDGALPAARLVETPVRINRRGPVPPPVPAPDDDPRPSLRRAEPSAVDLKEPSKVPQPPVSPG